MSDRFKKDSTPPPLLLMPAGGGLTLTPPDQPNVLMPVVQSTPTLLDPEEEAEADSFIGQSPLMQPSQMTSASAPTGYFQAQPSFGSSDPFANVGLGEVPLSGPNSSQQPPPSTLPYSSVLPPSTIPSTSSTGSGNIYRHQGGRPQYAPPPVSSFTSPPTSQNTANFPSGNTPSSQPPTALVPPMTSVQNPILHNSGSSNSQATVAAGQDAAQYNGGLYYNPIRHHWCYQQKLKGEIDEVWRPFSVIDSTQLELAFTKLQESPNKTVVTNGGRFEVNVSTRTRSAVYWKDNPTLVRRCSWFFKREGDNRYIPYDENFSTQLENEYKKAMETGGWHRRLEFPGKEIIVMHNANVIVQFPASSAPDEWGNVQGDQTRPRVVKRGVDDFATIVYGEREEVDHLVFFVPGLEDLTGAKARPVEELVDDFRSTAISLIESHFTQAFQAKSVNRVEFLPIIWTPAIDEQAAGVHAQVGSVTLPSTAKLRHFVNNTLIDTLFYTSPAFCQKICETVGTEMNRMFHIFLEKNQSFSGDVSIAGHSLGSAIVFDLLLNQHMPGDFPSSNSDALPKEQPSVAPIEEVNKIKDTENGEDEESSLEMLLSKVGLESQLALFHSEQIDMESLLMCSEQDLKDIGLPMGPRKKLLGVLKDENVKKEQKLKEQAERKIQEELERKQTELAAAAAAVAVVSNGNQGTSIPAEYIKGQSGAGQLKVIYPQLDFTPTALFALGSPIAVYLSLRGVMDVGEFFQLPTCSRVYNIFHPAYRLEPLIRPSMSSIKPVQVPHYKGRKRLHLEFKEAVTRYGTDIKQKIIDSVKSTWNSIHAFAQAHRGDTKASVESEVQSGMDEMMSHIAQQHSEDDRGSISSMADEDIQMGQLNEGQRVDYVLQEGPLESFNDYLFALASHSCYWDSEDTALLMLREIYAPLGIRPKMPGAESGGSSHESSLPPRQGAIGNNPPGARPPSAAISQASPAPHNYFQSGQPPAITPPSSIPSSFDPSLAPAGPPPMMFNPQSSSQGLTGMRKSPYVAPDFQNLPQAQSGLPGEPVAPPPMGPAIAGGYRRTQLQKK